MTMRGGKTDDGGPKRWWAGPKQWQEGEAVAGGG
jgi:hypothetical protein